ncbi:HAD family hydrolase [Phycicoccus endophyticus]|uniref:HAD family hydrolase n=1 Tax=Phycicoccus endophyticus TaxID=1690220 RepID=A0A7G9QYC6_9MICO|nr:HAD family hydrolase [Phycicoccus endophyticus]NHI19244.1 HAD family hydrolase [Phycicoccus endophyticus]QNN48351.1 HAD family hydrolase [Phycicoccus endophyticus]GGL41267.1 hypothetical protein GCM10012283_24790 [Phycicoccus endophyticus]
MSGDPGVAAVLLDADDTLYDTRAAMHAAGAAAASRLWPQADPERLAHAGEHFRSDPEGHFTAYARGEIEFEEMRRARVAELAAWLDQAGEDWWDAFEEVYEPAFVEGLAAFDDVRATVVGLRSAGLAVGVLTNSSGDYTRVKMEASGLEGLFDVVCSRDTLGFGKPDPRAFHEACRRLGTEPAATLYVGDQLATDPLAADDAGLRAAWLVRAGVPDERSRRLVESRSVPVIAGLDAIAGLLERSDGRFGPGEGGR